MTELKKAKTKAWNKFSLYIRTRDALKTTGTTTHCKCVTCNKILPLKGHGGLQAGHFIAGRHNAVLFDERNVHAQCYGCNVCKKGNTTEYWLFMENTYGREVINELLQKDKTTVQYKAYQFEEIYQYFKKKLDDLTPNI